MSDEDRMWRQYLFHLGDQMNSLYYVKRRFELEGKGNLKNKQAWKNEIVYLNKEIDSAICTLKRYIVIGRLDDHAISLRKRLEHE